MTPEIAEIPLHGKTGKGKVAIVDADDAAAKKHFGEFARTNEEALRG